MSVDSITSRLWRTRRLRRIRLYGDNLWGFIRNQNIQQLGIKLNHATTVRQVCINYCKGLKGYLEDECHVVEHFREYEIFSLATVAYFSITWPLRMSRGSGSEEQDPVSSRNNSLMSAMTPGPGETARHWWSQMPGTRRVSPHIATCKRIETQKDNVV